MEVSADGTTEGERLYVAQGVSVKKLPEKKREFRGKKKTGVLTDVHQNQATVHKKYSKVFSFIVVSFRFYQIGFNGNYLFESFPLRPHLSHFHCILQAAKYAGAMLKGELARADGVKQLP